MNLAPNDDPPDSELDPVWYAHALERATEDFQRIATLLTERYIGAGLAQELSWPLLLEIEEQAFSDLAFLSRNDPVIVGALPRIGPATMPGINFSGLIDWSRTDPSLPIVYRCVREHLVGVHTSGNGQEAT